MTFISKIFLYGQFSLFLFFYFIIIICMPFNKIFLYRPNMRTRKLKNLVFDHFYFIKKKYVFKTTINVETIPGSGFNSQLLKLFTYTCKY